MKRFSSYSAPKRAASERSFPCGDDRFNLRPTSANIQKLRYQLANPRFGEHHLFFLQSVGRILRLARGCTASSGLLHYEFYADFVAGDPYHFTLNMPSTHLYMLPAVVDPSGLQRYSDRVVDGIAAVFLALKRRPVIRYQRTSDTAKRIAHETATATPLPDQWTYQAMVHELIGLHDNKVDLRFIGSLPKDQQVEVVLLSEQDSFFKSNMYLGILGMNIKRMVGDFQKVAKSNQNIHTVEDMARFVDSYPEYKKMQGNVSKHVTLVTEMSKLVEASKLMLAKELHMSVSDIDRLRLVMMYALRYEKENPVQLMQLFNKWLHGLPSTNQGESRSVDATVQQMASRSPKYKPGGVENVYTQHQPLLFQTMESITRGRLRDVD
ncbi:hypothetical protein DY000_02062275 [Brassica cretica]|uniref:rRNA N-glycosidase n=1 Tax=Brassica cretica TaxID=69181 RepID=A0ABQ7AZM4_BRACR|nr:hypothetical protein DY000_02062275 [Brassica cretica]